MSVSPTSVFSTSGGVLLFYITNGQNYCPFFAQCKVTINIITWAHCMYSQIRSISCLMCSQLEQFQSIQIVRKALFFKLIYTPIYTRSFSRGFSLATSSYVLGGRTALIAAKLYCGLGNYSQTAIFPRMPSVTEISKSVNMGSLLGAGCIVLENL
jgi:hypothetical protein